MFRRTTDFSFVALPGQYFAFWIVVRYANVHSSQAYVNVGTEIDFNIVSLFSLFSELLLLISRHRFSLLNLAFV